MRFLFIGLILCLLPTVSEAAEQAQAREVARLNNCPPKKVEVYQNSLGSEGKTIYRVQCNLPKATGENQAPQQDSLLIACASSLSEVIRPTTQDKK